MNRSLSSRHRRLTTKRRRSSIPMLGAAFLAGAMVLSLCPGSGAQAVDLSNLPDHPRLFLRENLIPLLQSEGEPGQPKADMYFHIKRKADDYLDDAVSSTREFKILTLALAGWIEEDTLYLDGAVEQFMYSVDQGWAWQDNDLYIIAYDWVYPHMTTEQRDAARSTIRGIYSDHDGQRTVYYNLEANEAVSEGLAGLATYGDGGGSGHDDWAQDLVDECDGRMRGVREFAYPGGSASSLGGVLPTRQFYFPDGGYYKGGHYCLKDLVSIVTFLHIWDDLQLGDHWGIAGTYIDGLPEYFVRSLRPDYTWYRTAPLPGIYPDEERLWWVMSILATARHSGLASWFLYENNWDSGSNAYTWHIPFVAWRPSTPPTQPSALPLYRFYGTPGTTNVFGGSWFERVIIRSGWNFSPTSDDLYFHLGAGKFFGDYLSFNQLGFEIYYRGGLAIKSGEYGDNEHNRNYNANNSSANTVVVVNPGASEANDLYGSDFLYDDPGRPVNIHDVADGSVYDNADIDRFSVLDAEGTPGNWYFIRAVLEPEAAYVNTNGFRGLDRYSREVFVAGHNFVFRDSVQVDDSSRSVRWLLHTVGEPEMTSDLISTGVSGHLETFGLGSYETDRVWEDYSGKISVAPLLPTGATLRRVGGEGYECWIDDGDGGGENWPPRCDDCWENEDELGSWRVETIAPPSQLIDFVHHVWVGRPGQSAPEARAVEGAGLIGCEVDGVGVFMFRDGDETVEGFRYETTFGAIPSLRHSVSGVSPAMAYAIYENDKRRETCAADDQGVLSFHTSGPGQVWIVPAEVATQLSR